MHEQFIKKYSSFPWQKAEMHVHTKEDPVDGPHIDYSIYDFIDEAARRNYTIIGWTNHNKVPDPATLSKAKEYATSKGILLIPGVEHRLGRKEVLLYFDYDIPHNEILSNITTLADVKRFHEKGMIRLIGAPHPFHPLLGLGKLAVKNWTLFHFFEFSWFYSDAPQWMDPFFNRSRKAKTFAKTKNIPIVATGDLHFLDKFSKEYTEVRCRHDLESFFTLFEEIRKQRPSNKDFANLIRYKTAPLTKKEYLKYMARILRGIGNIR